MLPTLCGGDLIIYRPIKRAEYKLLKKGCLIVASHPFNKRTLLIKRLYNKSSISIEIRGDNQTKSSDSRKFGRISKDNLKGIVEVIIKRSN